LASQNVVDQFTDPGFRVLGHLVSSYPESEAHIKTAALDLGENEERSASAFAWPDRRLFPIDSPAQAALSRLYLEKQAHLVPQDVVDRCVKALDMYGVDMPLRKKHAAAVDDSHEFLLPKVRRFRVIDGNGVKLAAEAIIQNKRRMDVNTRATASTNLVKKAVAFGTPVPKAILKMAGVTMCDTKLLRDHLEVRARATTNPTVSIGYTKLAEAVNQMPPLCSDRQQLIKTAAAINELDEGGKLDLLYDRKIPDALDAVFNTDKLAEEILELAGKQVPMDVLLSIDPETYADILGEDLASEFVSSTGEIDPEQLKVILPTVPRDLLAALTVQMGV